MLVRRAHGTMANAFCAVMDRSAFIIAIKKLDPADGLAESKWDYNSRGDDKEAQPCSCGGESVTFDVPVMDWKKQLGRKCSGFY